MERDKNSTADASITNAMFVVPDNIVDALVKEASWRDRASIAQHVYPASASSTKLKLSPKVPSTWTADSSIQLVPPKQSDTTDRSLFRRSRKAHFDPDGYQHDRGLRRQIFYKSGYLSCAACNGITFIDAAALRTVLELKAFVEFGSIRPESLPPCVVCGETGGLRVGVHDFLSLIEGGKEALALRRRLERAAAKTLQRAFRRHLNIQWRKAETARQRTIYLLGYRCAQVIQAMLRGRLGRRVYETEKWLAVVKKANRLLIKHALKHFPHRKRVFWYKNEAEEEQLYSDYRQLVQRTGFRPPRSVVEGNIREIAIRVLEREAELVRRIQARWRGLSVRRYLMVFRRELRRQREVRAAVVFRIQRNVRGFLHRRRVVRCRSKKAGEMARRMYLRKRGIECNAQACSQRNASLCKAYVIERQEELTARLMGHTNPKLAGGHKMKAFHESPYGGDVVTELMKNQVEDVLERDKQAEEKDAERKRRAEWVRLKQLEDPHLAMYFEEEVTARNVYVINKLNSVAAARRELTRVSSTLRYHNETGGRKYDFPEHVNRDPMAVLNERHATDGQALLRRFSKTGQDQGGDDKSRVEVTNV